MRISDSSKTNLAVIRECTSTSVPSCSWWGAHTLTVCIWLLIRFSLVLWTECPFVTGVCWMQFWNLVSAFLHQKGTALHIPRPFCSVIQSNLSAGGWDNLLWELLIWGTALIVSQPLHIVLLPLSYHTLQNFCYNKGWINEILTEGMTD